MFRAPVNYNKYQIRVKRNFEDRYLLQFRYERKFLGTKCWTFWRKVDKREYHYLKLEEAKQCARTLSTSCELFKHSISTFVEKTTPISEYVYDSLNEEERACKDIIE